MAQQIPENLQKIINDRAEAWIFAEEPDRAATQELPALTGDDFIDNIMVEHSQFITLLEQARTRLDAFLDGDSTLGAISRLRDEISKALPATMPTELGRQVAVRLAGGGK